MQTQCSLSYICVWEPCRSSYPSKSLNHWPSLISISIIRRLSPFSNQTPARHFRPGLCRHQRPNEPKVIQLKYRFLLQDVSQRKPSFYSGSHESVVCGLTSCRFNVMPTNMLSALTEYTDRRRSTHWKHPERFITRSSWTRLSSQC